MTYLSPYLGDLRPKWPLFPHIWEWGSKSEHKMVVLGDICVIMSDFGIIYVHFGPIHPIFADWGGKMNKKWLKTPHYPPYMQFRAKNGHILNKKRHFLAILGCFWRYFGNILTFLSNICTKLHNLSKHLIDTPLTFWWSPHRASDRLIVWLIERVIYWVIEWMFW